MENRGPLLEGGMVGGGDGVLQVELVEGFNGSGTSVGGDELMVSGWVVSGSLI